LVLVEREQAHVIVPGQPGLDLRAGAVGRAVVDDDELVHEVTQLVEDLRDGRLFVVRGNDRDASHPAWPVEVGKHGYSSVSLTGGVCAAAARSLASAASSA